jgi:S1-C subfamily serine protease
MSSKQNTHALAELSSQLSGAVENAAAYTVAIHARRRIPSSGVVWRDGLIVSASHTVRRDGTVVVTLPTGESANATVVGRDPATDLVALRISDAGLKPAPRAGERDSGVGSLVLAVGRPGRTVSASFGIISAVNTGWRGAQGARIDSILRLDAAVYDGFSGGPLVATSGAVIGINNSALARGSAATLPATVVDSVVDELIARGHIRRPFIGVAVHPVTLSAATVSRIGRPTDAALVVLSVADGAPADAAGVLVGDVLTEIDGHALARPADLLDVLAGVPEGMPVELTLVRGGERRALSLTPADREVGGPGE